MVKRSLYIDALGLLNTMGNARKPTKERQRGDTKEKADYYFLSRRPSLPELANHFNRA